jgi:glucosamine--fructose-6-phosphate aminotransferase (isomerizing)
MCGIVGILGREPVTGSLLHALKRLEYRGYDSAGIATLENGQLARRRAEGKLRNLEARLAGDPLAGTIGIGHTRWATHGRPTESVLYGSRGSTRHPVGGIYVSRGCRRQSGTIRH